jgi:hypothetical protein
VNEEIGNTEKEDVGEGGLTYLLPRIWFRDKRNMMMERERKKAM